MDALRLVSRVAQAFVFNHFRVLEGGFSAPALGAGSEAAMRSMRDWPMTQSLKPEHHAPHEGVVRRQRRETAGFRGPRRSRTYLTTIWSMFSACIMRSAARSRPYLTTPIGLLPYSTRLKISEEFFNRANLNMWKGYFFKLVKVLVIRHNEFCI